MEITSTTPTKSKVTIICVTYNQEKYIRQCLDSLVVQKTNFPYQIFVGEDCSTDGTREIIKEYSEKYKEKIVPFLRTKNLGSTENFCDLVDRINTPYFAFCDGDDFWTDENRLQKQFDFMEKHPDYGACFCRASIVIEDNWGLEKHYKKSKGKNLIWPDCQHTFPTNKKFYTVKDLAKWMPTQSVNVFIRRNGKVLMLPTWMRELYICDAPTICVHVGSRKIKFMKQNMCSYRRSQSGIFFSESMTEHMIKTRPQYIKYFNHLKHFFNRWNGGFARIEIENRIKLEVFNYFNALISKDMMDTIAEFIAANPDVAKIALKTYMSFYSDQRRLSHIFSWEGYKLINRSKKTQVLLYPLIKALVIIRKLALGIKKRFRKIKAFIRKIIKKMLEFILYYINSLIPKKQNRWVFTSFKQQGYLDNSKYFYEYVVNNHPEIEAIWITRNKEVMTELSEKGYKFKKAKSIGGMLAVAKASLVITDHFRMTDYPSCLGFNKKTKTVNLWHGVGFKSMGDGTVVKNSNIPGVVYSYDIIPNEADKFLQRLKKRIKRIFVEPSRELFEEYFAMVCPGQERVDMVAGKWNLPEDRYIFAGHPRNEPVYKMFQKQEKRETFNIIYAPTYRMKYWMELDMVNRLIEAMPLIDETMGKINGTFTLRMHPHTWRGYRNTLEKAMSECNHIIIDEEKDVYNSLSNYDLLISDYSSIALDFAMFNRPAIFLIEDYDEFVINDAGFGVDFLNMTPGPQTYNWEETMTKIVEIKSSGQTNLDSQYKEILSYYFTEEKNTVDNSKVIFEELIKRLAEDKNKHKK